MKPRYMLFPQVLKAGRAVAGLTQAELLEAIGEPGKGDTSKISGWETGKYLPQKAEHVRAIACACHLPEEPLLTVWEIDRFLVRYKRLRSILTESVENLELRLSALLTLPGEVLSYEDDGRTTVEKYLRDMAKQLWSLQGIAQLPLYVPSDWDLDPGWKLPVDNAGAPDHEVQAGTQPEKGHLVAALADMEGISREALELVIRALVRQRMGA